MIHSTINASSMKNNNRFTVLKCIRENNFSRADISRKTSLTRASITNIVDDLIQNGLVIENGYGEQKVGKRAIQLAINSSYAYAIGISITKKFYYINLINLTCEIIEEEKKLFSDFINRDEVMEFFTNKILDFKEKYKDKILGIGISSPGPVDSLTGTIQNPPNMKDWHYFNICQFLFDKSGLPVFLEKDINAYAIIEKTFGTDSENFVELFADDGIGSAIVLNNKLLHTFGQGAELGHITLDYFDGRKCPCGNIGCVEMYASIPNLLRDYSKQGIEFSSWKAAVDSAYQDDERALTILNAMARYLSAALISFLNIININTIVFSSELTYRPNLLFDKIKEIVTSQTISKTTKHIKIVTSKINNITNQSPGNIVLDKFFNNEL